MPETPDAESSADGESGEELVSLLSETDWSDEVNPRPTPHPLRSKADVSRPLACPSQAREPDVSLTGDTSRSAKSRELDRSDEASLCFTRINFSQKNVKSGCFEAAGVLHSGLRALTGGNSRSAKYTSLTGATRSRFASLGLTARLFSSTRVPRS